MIGSLIHDRYRIESELGRGGMGLVYQAEDTLLERPVAIKVVSASSLGTEGRSRLLQEARAAARLNHPNIVAVYDVGEAQLPDQRGPISFIVMELVEGQTLREHPRRELEQALKITKDICGALSFAHQQGIIHRDLKPENVSVTSTDTVKLMDFGLARITGKTRLTEQGAFMGTLSYMAPEIILGQEASPSSDLYALGVMLYEMSAGRPPFEAENLTAVISQHLHAPVVPPSVYNDQIPPALNELIVQLLSKRPEDRPSSARDVHDCLDRILLVGSDPQPLAAIPQLNRLVRGRMIGREEEFGEAISLWQKTTAGQGQFLLISGEPGIGKTRMVRELSTYAEISGGKTLVGLCYADERKPYSPIAQMVETSLENGYELNLPEPVLADLLTLAPELRLNYPDVPPNDRLDPEAEQQRLFESIVTWSSALTKNGNLLLVIDDVHWADSGSLALLRHLARRIGRRRALVVATYREVELDEALPLQELLGDLNRERLSTRIKLSRLSKEQTRDLLTTIFAEEITPEFLEGIYRETEGNPFFIEEVCRALVDSGELFFEGGRWHRPDMEKLEIPQSIKVTIQSRLAKLSEEDQDTLQIAALLGRDFEYGMLSTVSDLDEDRLINVLERAEQAQLVEEVRRPGFGKSMVFSFTHALIHSTLLSNLSTLRRQRLQRQVALDLETSFPRRRQELAPLLGRYFAEAGDGEKAIEYLLIAGDDSRQVYAYKEAIEDYEQALIFLRELEDHQRSARTLMKLGLTYHNIFAFDESRQAYEEGFAEWQRVADSEYMTAKSLPEAPHALRSPTYIPPATLDPASAHDGWSAFVIDLLFSGLLELTADDELIPNIARSWEVLDGGTRYVFHLRDDVQWSDGSRVTADDFEYAWKRALDPSYGANLVTILYDIKGAQAYHRGQENNPESVGVNAIDENTLVVLLESPSSYFLQLLSLPITMAVPRQAIESHGSDWTEPDKIITNGPFQIHTWLPEELLVLERYPDYHGRFKGNLTQIQFPITPVKTYLDLYERDALDTMFPDEGSVEECIRAIQLHPDEYLTEPSPGVLYLTFDVTKPPFDDANVRQALALAIDRKTLVSTSVKGIYFPATGGFVPPGIPGHVPGIASPYDPNLAGEKLAQSGYPGGEGFPDIEFLVSHGHNPGNVMGLFVKQWAEILQIQISIKLSDFNTVLHRISNNPPQMWAMGWTADYPDPDNYLRVGTWLRYSGWRHREYESLVNDARRMTDQEQRMAMYRQAERILVEEMPSIPISYGRSHYLIKPWVTTWPSSIVKGPIFKDIIIEPH